MIKIYSRDYWRPPISDSKGNYFKMTPKGLKQVPWLSWEQVTSYLRNVKPLKTAKDVILGKIENSTSG